VQVIFYSQIITKFLPKLFIEYLCKQLIFLHLLNEQEQQMPQPNIVMPI